MLLFYLNIGIPNSTELDRLICNHKYSTTAVDFRTQCETFKTI